jgi:mycothiol synthase
LLAEFGGAYLDEFTDRMNERDVLDWWRGRELESESIGISAGETGLAAFGLLAPREQGVVELQAFVHPDARGRGLGSFLLDWAEDASRRRASRNLRTVIFPGDEAARPLVAARGIRLVRHSYRMVVDLAEPPAEPHWPEGFSLSTMLPGEEPILYEVIEEAFAAEWGRPSRSFEEWQRAVFSQDSFDAALCYLVREDGRAVAAEHCARRFGMGWIGSIGVLAPWRRRGLGEALLLHGFGELYRRGERRIGLGVDASNPTGATRLYERVGMRVAWQADTYEKAL